MVEQREPSHDDSTDYVVEASALRGLAHPLRLRLLGLLRLNGPSTASRLAAVCGESSGLTSYHLRELASAGHIAAATADDLRNVELTGGRERWWKASYRSTWTDTPDREDPASVAADADYSRAVLNRLFQNAESWISVRGSWSERWQRASTIDDYLLHLTSDEAESLNAELRAVMSRFTTHDPAATGLPQGSAVVSLQYQLFPHPDQVPRST